MNEDLHPCKCCGQRTISGPNSDDICAVCGWQQGYVQENDHDFGGGANEMSLTEARAYWQATGQPIPINRTPQMKEARRIAAEFMSAQR